MPPSTFLCHEGKPCFVTETWDHLWRRPSVSTWSRRALLLPWSRRARRGRSIRCSSSPFLASVYNISVAERYTINLAKRSPVAWPLFLYDIFFPEAVAVLAACAEWLFCGWCSASLHGLLIIFVLRLRWKSNVTATFRSLAITSWRLIHGNLLMEFRAIERGAASLFARRHGVLPGPLVKGFLPCVLWWFLRIVGCCRLPL